MKTTLLFFFILCFSITLQAQFTIIQTSTTEILNDVHFINPQVGFAVGENGAMVKTIDGGDNWSTLNLNTSENLSRVQFIDSNVGFVLSDTILFKTIDGGNNFTQKVFSETMKDFYFISATEGKIAGYHNGSVVLSTTDGGNTFSSQMLDASWYAWDSLQGMGIGNYYTLVSIDYANGQWEVGGNDYDYNGGDYTYALYSTDGVQWTNRYLDLNLPYGDSDAAIIDIATNSNGDVFHLKKPSSDKTYLYKNEWKTLIAPQNEYFNKMNEFGFLNDSILLIPTNGNIRIYNVNDGFTQLTEDTIASIVLTGGVGMVNNTIGCFTGEDGKIAKYTDLNSSISNISDIDFKLFPNPAEDYLIIESNNNYTSIEIIDLNGRIVFQHLSVLNNKIDVSNLPSGLYFLKLIDKENIGVQKFIKK